MRRPHATCDVAFHPGKSMLNFLSCLVVICFKLRVLSLKKQNSYRKEKLFVKGN